MTLELFHPTDPRYLIYPLAPDTLDNADVFAGLYGRMLTVCQGDPDATYTLNSEDVWVKGASGHAAGERS